MIAILMIMRITLLSMFWVSQDAWCDLEIITKENANRIELIASWENNGNLLADFNPVDNVLAVYVDNNTIRLISTDNLEVLNTLEHISMIGDSLKFSNDGSRLLLSNRYGAFMLWNLTNYEVIVDSNEQTDEAVFFYSDNLQKIYRFETTTNEVSILNIINSDEELRVSFLRFFAPNEAGDTLITDDEDGRSVSVWDVQSGDKIITIGSPFTGNRYDLQGVGFTPSGNIWVSWQNNSNVNGDVESESVIQFWDIKQQKVITTLAGEDQYHRLVFDPTGEYVIAVGSIADDFGALGNITIWDLETTEQVIRYRQDTRGFPLVFNTSGNLYAIASPNQLRVYPLLSDLPLSYLPIGDSFQLRFSHDSKLLLNVGYEITLWGIPSLEASCD